jgi:mono/diheme cytochrome c family protein
MAHATVTRFATGLSALLLAACLLYSARALGRPADAGPAFEGGATPAELFARHCGGCHDASELASGLASGSDRAEGVLDMLDLLEQHGAGAPGEDRAIVRFLTEADPEARR